MLGVSLRLPAVVSSSASASADPLSQSLASYIESNYGSDEFKAAQTSLGAVATIRHKAFSSVTASSASLDCTSSIGFIESYYSLLANLSTRFPFGSQAATTVLGIKVGKVPSVRVPFTWCDSLHSAHRVTDYDVNFEKSSVLFNLGALYSRQATFIKATAAAAPTDSASSSGSSPSDSALKESIRLFSLSSGVFDFLLHSTQLGSNSAASHDFHPESLAFLSKFMLAQSGSCFFERATQSASARLVARLACGVSQLYQAAEEDASKGAIKQLSSVKEVYRWESHCAYQRLCYRAASHFWFAKSLAAEEKWGEEICQLQRAAILLNEAAKLEKSLVKALADNRKQLEMAVDARLKAALKDNETCYYAPVPPTSAADASLPEPLISVKPGAFQPSVDSSSDPFSRLVPLSVRTLASDVRVRLTEFAASHGRAAQESSDYSRQFLASLNLPAAIEALQAGAGKESPLPAEVWDRVFALQQKILQEAPETQIQRLKAGGQDANAALSVIKSELSKERSADEELRSQFPDSWSRPSSDSLTGVFQRELATLEGFLSQAKESDAKIVQQFQQSAHELELVRSDRKQIESRFPSAEEAAGGPNASADALKASLDRLAILLHRRSEINHALQTAIKEIDSLQLALNQQSKTPEQIVETELARLNGPAELKALAEEEAALLKQIAIENQTFESSTKRSDQAMMRQAIIQELNQAMGAVEKLMANLAEGLKFYSQLKNQRIEPLEVRCREFVNVRETEARICLNQITRRIAALQINEQSAAAQSNSPPPFNPAANLPAPSAPMSPAQSSSNAGPLCPLPDPCATPYPHWHCRCTLINGQALKKCSLCDWERPN